MIGTILWRIQEAVAVLLGKKKTERNKIKPNFPQRSIHNLPPINISTETKEYINSKKIEFFFIEIGENRVNAGGNTNLQNEARLEPSYSTLKHYFPNAKFIVYSDFDLNVEGVELRKIPQETFDLFEEHPRKFYRITNYMKFYALSHSDADIAICFDTDMFIFTDDIYSLIYMTDKFGFCVPNFAMSMNKEIQTSLDVYPITDESRGYGSAVNITPLTLKTSDEKGKTFYTECMNAIAERGSRASIAMWNATWKTGIYPYLLPREFCVCRGSEGIDNEVILHIGHKSVADYYNIKI